MRRIKINHNQLSLPFDSIKSGTISYEDRVRFFWTLASISLLALTAYIYAINATAHNIAVRQHLEREVSQMSAELSILEFKHIALQNAVTIEVARNYGFSEVKQPLYVSRESEDTLTLNSVKR